MSDGPDGDPGLATARHLILAPLAYRGKVRELYDLGEHWLIVVTDRISAFDTVLSPPIPGKGKVLNRLSALWFARTSGMLAARRYAAIGRAIMDAAG